MSRVKKRLPKGILICALVCTIAAVSIPTVAVNSATATNGEEAQEDSGNVSGIKLETPSGATRQTQGKAEIEKYFPATDSSDSANSENSAEMNVSNAQRENSQELPIIYEQQQENEASETNISAPKNVEQSWNSLYLLLIPVIIVLLFVAIKIFKKKKKEVIL